MKSELKLTSIFNSDLIKNYSSRVWFFKSNLVSCVDAA